MSRKTISSSILITLIFLFGAITFNHSYRQIEAVQAQDGDGQGGQGVGDGGDQGGDKDGDKGGGEGGDQGGDQGGEGDQGGGGDQGSPGSPELPEPGLHALRGYAWSSNVGWIHFDPSPCWQNQSCGVYANFNPATHKAILSGYAWANPRDATSSTNNIGWLNFNDFTNCPTAPCTQAQIDYNTTPYATVTGWARFYSAPGNNNAGDWDGWVHLSGSNYGGKVDPVTNNFTTGSYFWGGGSNCNNLGLGANCSGSNHYNGTIQATSTPGWIHLCDALHNPAWYCVRVETSCVLVAPAAPQNFSAATDTQCGGGISLSWSPPSGGQPTGGYHVYRDGQLLHPNPPLSPTDTSFVDSPLTPGSTHTYQIAAFNSCSGTDLEGPRTPLTPLSATSSAVCAAVSSGLSCLPATVAKNTPSTLHWNVTASVPTNCTITQPGGVDSGNEHNFPYSFLITPPSGSGSRSTMPLQQSLQYVLTCTGGTITQSNSASCFVGGDYRHY